METKVDVDTVYQGTSETEYTMIILEFTSTTDESRSMTTSYSVSSSEVHVRKRRVLKSP